jgi:hypothetical protein
VLGALVQAVKGAHCYGAQAEPDGHQEKAPGRSRSGGSPPGREGR